MSLEIRLPAILEGYDLPADAEEGASFARLAFARHQHAESARLWAESFASSPELAADLTAANRFQAARAAASAGTELGREHSNSEAGSRARWRKQALDWLSADLTASAAVLNSGTYAQRAAGSKRLGRWRVDPTLAGIRDEPALAEIPEPERRSLREFWRRVEALHAEATAPLSPGPDVAEKIRRRL
jgi:serine/threonine-protein kinase